MIQERLKLFDTLHVAIGENPNKKYVFSLEDRLSMLRDSLAEISDEHSSTKIYIIRNQFLADFAKNNSIRYVLRGIRNTEDYEYEKIMRHINSDINPNLVSIYLMPPRELGQVSSSLVKNLLGVNRFEEIIRPYVPDSVYKKIMEVYKK
jgi:pantetheine-phosphate adenylyltransferase